VVQSEDLRIPLEDGIADAAVLAFVLHEPPDPGAFIREVSRVLAPSGRILVVEWQKWETEHGGPPIEFRLSPDETRRMLETAGYSVQELPSISDENYLLLGVR
jgi:SAM-dependent methyltransferase